MVVSFVNAGLLTLTQSISVIMGANVGTTVTAWIISLFGFKVDISVFSLPLIGLCIPLIFSGKSKRKSWGEFFNGFCLPLHGAILSEIFSTRPAKQSSNPFFLTRLYLFGISFPPYISPFRNHSYSYRSIIQCYRCHHIDYVYAGDGFLSRWRQQWYWEKISEQPLQRILRLFPANVRPGVLQSPT